MVHMFQICAAQHGSHQLFVAVEHWKGGSCDLRTEVLILFNFNSKLDLPSGACGCCVGQPRTSSLLLGKTHSSQKGHLKGTAKVARLLVCTSRLQTSSCRGHHRGEIRRLRGLKSERHHIEIQETPNFFRDVFGKLALCVSPLCFQLTQFEELSLLFSFLLQEQCIFTTQMHEEKTNPGDFCSYLSWCVCVHARVCVSVCERTYIKNLHFSFGDRSKCDTGINLVPL